MRPWVAPVALLVAALSLVLNLYLLAQLRRPERLAAAALAAVAERLGGEDATFRYEIELPAGTPIELDIPVNERFTVAVDTQIPINTTVRLPIRSPIGNYNVNVPVQADIPLRTALPLHIRHTFRLRTRTDTTISIPLEIRLRDLPLDSLFLPRSRP